MRPAAGAGNGDRPLAGGGALPHAKPEQRAAPGGGGGPVAAAELHLRWVPWRGAWLRDWLGDLQRGENHINEE